MSKQWAVATLLGSGGDFRLGLSVVTANSEDEAIGIVTRSTMAANQQSPIYGVLALEITAND